MAGPDGITSLIVSKAATLPIRFLEFVQLVIQLTMLASLQLYIHMHNNSCQ